MSQNITPWLVLGGVGFAIYVYERGFGFDDDALTGGQDPKSIGEACASNAHCAASGIGGPNAKSSRPLTKGDKVRCCKRTCVWRRIAKRNGRMRCPNKRVIRKYGANKTDEELEWEEKTGKRLIYRPREDTYDVVTPEDIEKGKKMVLNTIEDITNYQSVNDAQDLVKKQVSDISKYKKYGTTDKQAINTGTEIAENTIDQIKMIQSGKNPQGGVVSEEIDNDDIEKNLNNAKHLGNTTGTIHKLAQKEISNPPSYDEDVVKHAQSEVSRSVQQIRDAIQ